MEVDLNICWNYETVIVTTRETQMQGQSQLEIWFLFMTNNLDAYGGWLRWLRLYLVEMAKSEELYSRLPLQLNLLH